MVTLYLMVMYWANTRSWGGELFEEVWNLKWKYIQKPFFGYRPFLFLFIFLSFLYLSMYCLAWGYVSAGIHILHQSRCQSNFSRNCTWLSTAWVSQRLHHLIWVLLGTGAHFWSISQRLFKILSSPSWAFTDSSDKQGIHWSLDINRSAHFPN